MVHSTDTVIVIPETFDGRAVGLTVDNLAISGAITLGPNGLINSNSVTLNGGTLSGEGIVNTPSFINSGFLSPGEDIATLDTLGSYEQTSLGVLEVELGGLLPGVSHDALEITSSAKLDGSLSIELVGGYTPPIGSTFTVLTASALEGQFSSLQEVTSLPNGLAWNVLYGTSSVAIQLVSGSLSGDYNADGTVDAADYTVWQDNLGLDASALNGNGSGAATVVRADYLLWKTNFEALASGSEGTAAVPEPGSLLLALLALIAVPLRVRHG